VTVLCFLFWLVVYVLSWLDIHCFDSFLSGLTINCTYFLVTRLRMRVQSRVIVVFILPERMEREEPLSRNVLSLVVLSDWHMMLKRNQNHLPGSTCRSRFFWSYSASCPSSRDVSFRLVILFILYLFNTAAWS
jgi:hypothetical protein